ncbi:serine hydrolase [bacterium]|nr:serine hydrolase [bacterium]
MPEPRYNYNVNTDLYTSMYEQYYFKNTPIKKIKPIKRKKKNKKRSAFAALFLTLISVLLLFFVFPYSFKNITKDVVKLRVKAPLNVDYKQIMFPTHSYLYKDLFLGKYSVKDATYKEHIMIDMPESSERMGLRNNLLLLAQQYPKIQPSIYVWEYGGQSYVNINANEPYPAASIIKVPVLIEMFRNIEHGKFNLYDTMVLEDYYRASGSGKLQYSEGGVAHTMDYLARIMIQNSDNSSTNMIIAKIGGMPEINKAMKRWGLKTTHINNWLPDLGGTNITTAKEMAKMFYNIDSTNILTTQSKRQIADYMGHVKNNRLLQAGLPEGAILLHKTGDIGYMLGDAGIVKTTNGKKYIVVILAMRPYNNLQGKEFIVKASEMIYNNISY